MTGFSSVLGPGLLRRALEDEGVDPARAQADDFRRALPRLEKRMRAYVSEGIAATRARRIRAWLDEQDGFVSDPDDEPSLTRSAELMRELRQREQTGEFRRGDLAHHLRDSATFERDRIVADDRQDDDSDTSKG